MLLYLSEKFDGLGQRLVVGGMMLAVMAFASGCATTQAASGSAKMNKDSAEVGDDVPNPVTLYSLAKLYIAQGKDQQGEMVLVNTIRDFPEFTPAYSKLAELQVRQGRLDEAEGHLNTALELQMSDPVIHNNLGICELIQGDFQNALKQFEIASEMVPQEKRYTANSALAYGLMGEMSEAERLYRYVLPQEDVEYNLSVIREMNPAQVVQSELFELLN